MDIIRSGKKKKKKTRCIVINRIHERNVTKKLNRVATNYSSATMNPNVNFMNTSFRDVGSPAKLKLIVKPINEDGHH